MKHFGEVGFILLFEDRVCGFVDFDGGGHAGHLRGTDKMSTHADAGFEEIGVVLDLLGAFEELRLRICGFEDFEWVGE